MESKEVSLKRLGSRIAAIRKQKGLTQEELAHRVGKDGQSIQRVEVGKINPSYYYLCEIAEGLGVDVKEFFG